MDAVRRFDLENPWVYVFTNVVVWVVVVSTIETVLFDGDLTSAAVSGTGGGFVFGIAMLYLRTKA
ncbi:hypothetical protein [Halorubrum sp. SP9]|uniref:hypothetical protein n=1 Tax=Halorubrum sp. SP9 TaxID=1537267 RepID=UPI0010F9ED46|nr:hypothetical protein [Halorubrum sp. SP9]TKX68645.1 hypothetical protein EXE45_10970 [Halorubrum sp. SP9]